MANIELLKKFKKLQKIKKELIEKCYVINNIDDNEVIYIYNREEFEKYFIQKIWGKKAFRVGNKKTLKTIEQLWIPMFVKMYETEENKQNDFIHDMQEQGLI